MAWQNHGYEVFHPWYCRAIRGRSSTSRPDQFKPLERPAMKVPETQNRTAEKNHPQIAQIFAD